MQNVARKSDIGLEIAASYRKTCVKGHSQKMGFKTNYRLMQVKSMQNAPREAFCNTH